MAPHHRGKRTVKATRVIFGCAMAVFVLAADQAHAQSLFEAFFGFFRQQRSNYYQPSGLLQPPPRQRTRLLQSPRVNSQEAAPSVRETRRPAVQSLPAASYCVRLCDGRYFPLPRTAGTASAAPDKTCSAMCPATATRVFSGSPIEHAVAEDGKPYTSLRSAFLFREKQVDSCSCTNSGLPGIASLDVRDDPTLEPGDIVVTRDGPMVFTGSKRVPHQSSEFVPAKDYKGLPKSVRSEVEKIEVAEDDNFVPVQPSATPAAATPDPLPPVSRQDQQKDLTPVAATQSTTAR